MDEFEMNTEMDNSGEQGELSLEKPKKKRKLRKFAKYGLVLGLLVIGALVYNLYGCNRNSAEKIYEFENGANYQMAKYDDNILTLTYDGIKILRPNGKQKASLEYNMSNPHIDISGDMILLYDKESNKMMVHDGTKKRYTFESDQKIKSAKVNKNGYSVVVSDEVGYNSRVSVVDKRGQVIYKWQIGDEYIVDVDISPDNKMLVAATITTNTGSIVENIVFVDILKAEETGRTTTAGTMPLQVKFVENKRALVVSDTKLCGYDEKAKKLWVNNFENSLLDTFAIDEHGNTVVALRGIKNNSVLKMYTKNGRSTGEYISETQAVHVDIDSKYVAVCEKGKVSLIKLSGKPVSSAEIKKETSDMSLLSDNKVILLCSDGIQLIRM